MSKSYREPVFKDTYGTRHRRWAKNRANRKVRKTGEVPNGKAYRKFYNPWNIQDWSSRWDPWPSVITNWRTGLLEISEPMPEWKARRK